MGRLTGSRVGCLMRGDETRILALWRELTGDPGFTPPDLSGIWAVRLGEMTETLNLDWYTRTTGRPLTRRGEVVIADRAPWAASTLDGWDAGPPGPVDAKHVSGFAASKVLLARYAPQMTWQMICTGARWSALSIIRGARAPVIEIIPFDEIYAEELWRRAESFMRAVKNRTKPLVLAPRPFFIKET
ncbi:MAG TPA: YqaJ viral recombinase family protein [Stellaceae bacterium]|nr:YqaJ viral recombinase family protein [Stellaceae bacterium]